MPAPCFRRVPRARTVAGVTDAATTPDDPKVSLHWTLSRLRGILLTKLDGLGEYDVRRPMTPTGTNLLGLVKHCGSVQLGYFGEVFGRKEDWTVPWLEDDAPDGADMFALADESRAEIIEFFERTSSHADATIEELPLDASGYVPWWPEDRQRVSLHRVLVHVVQEFARHVGHADIVRETIDGATGNDNAHWTDEDPELWSTYRRRVEDAARDAAARYDS